VKICADSNCKIHFGERQQQEKQLLRWKAEKTAANQKAKRTLAFRHRLLAEVLKRVKPQLATEELRLVTRFVLRSLSYELACRVAKRHCRQDPQNARNRHMAEPARALDRKADAAGLTILLFEAMLVGPAGSATVRREDDPLLDAAKLYKIDVKALQSVAAKSEKLKSRKKAEAERANPKAASKTKTVPK
jgi:hypothetical protein